jgi:hypothetical protein
MPSLHDRLAAVPAFVDLRSCLPKRWLSSVAVACGLAACAALPPDADVQRLTDQQFAPTQTVDVLEAAPDAPFVRIARLRVADPTGVATREQLVAQLSGTARGLGADALVIERVERDDTSRVAFDPAGGQMQGGQAVASIAVAALAIRYSH